MKGAWRIVFLLASACAAGQNSCGGCPASSYQYPRDTLGKEPVQNAAQLRLNQGAVAFVKKQLPALIPGVCCDYDGMPAGERKQTPAESCWGKAPCFVESTSGAKLIHFYLGNPGAPLRFDVSAVGPVSVRNGDPVALQTVPDSASAAIARPYCNDLGGETFNRQAADIQAFCRAPGASGCNAAASDYCCGGDIMGDSRLPVCRGDQVVPRATGYPSNVSVPLAAISDPNNIELNLMPATATKPAGIGVRLRNIAIKADVSVAMPDFLGLSSIACSLKDTQSSNTLLASDISFSIRPRFFRSSPRAIATLDVCDDCVALDHFDIAATVPPIAADKRDVECQDLWGCTALFGCPAAALECDTACGLADFVGQVANPVIDLLKSQIANRIASAVADAVVGNLNGLPVEVQTQLDPRALLGDLVALRFGKPIGLLAGPSGQGFSVDGTGSGQGLRMSADIGAESDWEKCVPNVAPVPLQQIGDPALPSTIRIGDRDEAYHAAAAISAQAIERVLYSAFHSGLLCLGFGTKDIAALTGGKQHITAGLLFFLVPELQTLFEPSASIYFDIEPRGAPRVTLGTGAPGDSLVQAAIPKLGLSFYGFMYGRLVRIFSVETDVSLHASVLRTQDNKLRLSLDALGIDNVTSTFNELTEGDYSQVLSPLLEIATGSLLQGRIAFDLNFDKQLKDALKLPVAMRINGVQRAGEGNDFLAVYMTLCEEAQLSDPNNRACCTGEQCTSAPARDVFAITLSDRESLYEPAALASLGSAARPSGRVALHVGQGTFTTRIDSGPFTAPLRADENGDIVVSAARLRIPGPHELAVSRVVEGEVLSDEPLRLHLESDPERPKVRLVETASGVEVRASDLVTPEDELRVEWRRDGGAWQSGTRVGAGARLVEARAFDRAGNVSDVAVYRAPSAEAASTSEQTQGCHLTPDGSWALMLATLLSLRRRRNA